MDNFLNIKVETSYIDFIPAKIWKYTIFKVYRAWVFSTFSVWKYTIWKYTIHGYLVHSQCCESPQKETHAH